jgi:hypothetical protein
MYKINKQAKTQHWWVFGKIFLILFEFSCQKQCVWCKLCHQHDAHKRKQSKLGNFIRVGHCCYQASKIKSQK